MDIAIISSRYPDINNPYNHMFVHMRCEEMQKQGQYVYVYIPSNKIESYTYQNVFVRKMPSSFINSELEKHDVLYLHLLNIYPFQKNNGWIIYKYILEKRLPFAMYIHGNEVQRYSSRMFEFNYKLTDFLKWFKKDMLVIPKMKSFFKKAMENDNVIFFFPSLWMKNETLNNLKLVKISPCSIIPNGIETSFFDFNQSEEKRFKIMTIRSLSNKVYDIEKTIDVLSKLPKHYTLDIYGEGKYKNKYNRLIDKKGLKGRVKIVSRFFEKDGMKKLFKNYGIYISTTRMDSQGINMMEAMASGLLVATTDNSSKREFITNLENGVLATDAYTIANNIEKVTQNKRLYMEITENARRFTEKIDISKTVKKELVLLGKVASVDG